MDSFGLFLTFWDRLGQCWAIAMAICLIHSHLEPFGVIWSHLEKFEAVFLGFSICEKGKDFVLMEDLFSLGQLVCTRFLVDSGG